MNNRNEPRVDRAERIIVAPADAIYEAFIKPESLARWLAPAERAWLEAAVGAGVVRATGRADRLPLVRASLSPNPHAQKFFEHLFDIAAFVWYGELSDFPSCLTTRGVEDPHEC